MARKTLKLTDNLYEYLIQNSVKETKEQELLRTLTSSMERASMQIAPEQAQFFQVLVRAMGAKKTLEIGVFTGYSALAVALALPDDGRLFALDINPEWTDIALKFWRMAGIAQKITLKLAPAIETLDSLLSSGNRETFDFAFIDADKENIEAYFERCLELLRPGGVIAIDNVLCSGAVTDTSNREPNVIALREFNRRRSYDDRIMLSMIALGDGVSLAVKKQQ